MATLTLAHFFATGTIVLPGTGFPGIRRGLPIEQVLRALRQQNNMNMITHPQTVSRRIAELEAEIEDQRKAMQHYMQQGQMVEHDQAKQDYDGMIKELKQLKGRE